MTRSANQLLAIQLLFNPLTACVDYIRFLQYLSSHGISSFKHVEDKMWHKSVISENK